MSFRSMCGQEKLHSMPSGAGVLHGLGQRLPGAQLLVAARAGHDRRDDDLRRMRLLDLPDVRHPPLERLVGDQLPVPRAVQRRARRASSSRRCCRPASCRKNFVRAPTTLTTGCRPIVLVTTPPHPASKARWMLDSDSVGGAEESRKGFSNLIPVNVTDRLAMRISIGVTGAATVVRSSLDNGPYASLGTGLQLTSSSCPLLCSTSWSSSSPASRTRSTRGR